MQIVEPQIIVLPRIPVVAFEGNLMVIKSEYTPPIKIQLSTYEFGWTPCSSILPLDRWTTRCPSRDHSVFYSKQDLGEPEMAYSAEKAGYLHTTCLTTWWSLNPLRILGEEIQLQWWGRLVSDL